MAAGVCFHSHTEATVGSTNDVGRWGLAHGQHSNSGVESGLRYGLCTDTFFHIRLRTEFLIGLYFLNRIIFIMEQRRVLPKLESNHFPQYHCIYCRFKVCHSNINFEHGIHILLGMLCILYTKGTLREIIIGFIAILAHVII